MTTYEFKHVTLEYGIAGALDRQIYTQRVEAVLHEYGQKGWDLKAMYHDFGLHLHIVFGREVAGE